MQKRRQRVDASGLTPAMRRALERFRASDTAVSAGTLKALEQRGLVRKIDKKRWRWTAFAHSLREDRRAADHAGIDSE